MREELTEDELARRVYHLNTLHELNQEINTLRSLIDVLETSLLNIAGLFGLWSGLIFVYDVNERHINEYAYRGMTLDNAKIWMDKFLSHSGEPYTEDICIASEDDESPLANLMTEYKYELWLPMELDENIRGGIVLGQKLSMMSFTDDELELLSTIAINIQNVLSNVSLIEALNQAVLKESRIRNVFQSYAPASVVNEVLNPSNEQLLLGKSQEVRSMFDEMISQLSERYALEQELEVAHQVQQYLLPNKAPSIPGVEIVARSIPARGVCGDFFDFLTLSPYEAGLSLADISGKGLPAAIIAAMLQSATRMCVGNYYPIPATLSILNRFLFKHTEDIRYATMFYGQVDAQQRTFTYSNAGHPPAILCRGDAIKHLDKGGSLVGMFDDCAYDQDVIRLRTNDILVVYSDGVTDAGTTPESEDMDEAFGQERLESAILKNSYLPAKELLEAITQEVTEFTGNGKQFDDITIVVMKVD